MKCANLYGTTSPAVVAKHGGMSEYTLLTNVPGWDCIFVRAEIIQCRRAETLDYQSPRPGEIFLNGIPLDDEAKAS